MWITKSPLLKYYKKKNNSTLLSKFTLLAINTRPERTKYSIPQLLQNQRLCFTYEELDSYCSKYRCTVAVKVQTSVRYMFPEACESVCSDASGVQLPNL